MFNILDMWSDVGAGVVAAIRTLFSQIAFIIYDFIGIVYDLFIYLSRAQILDNEFVMDVYEKVGMLLGLFMVFKLMFSLIQSLIDPNKFTDKKSGFSQVIVRLVLSIVMLGITPTIFKEAYNIQNILVGNNDGGNNIFYKLIVGGSVNGDATSFGKTLAAELYFSFFTDEQEPYLIKTSEIEGSIDTSDMSEIEALKYKILTTGAPFSATNSALVYRDTNTNVYAVEFNFLFVIVFGCIVLWILFMYCFQVAVRVFQLAYLQLIAPIPIFSYISDPDGVFKKWISQCVATYIDLFIRLSIIYFIVFLSTDIVEQLNNSESILISSLGGINPTMLFFVRVILLVGLLLFAKKVPDLLKDLFPKLGGAGKFSFGLNPKKELFDPIAKSAPGKAIGWMGKKAVSGIDRIVYNTPKPRNKVQQWLDKTAPGYADAAKARKERLKDEKYDKEGELIYKRYGSDLPKDGSAFKNSAYRKSFVDLGNAKAALDQANEEYRKESARYTAAYNSGDPETIKNAESRMKTAESNKKAMEGKVELAQRKHDANKKIYTNDAAIEEKHSYYKKTHKELKKYEVEPYEQNKQIQSSEDFIIVDTGRSDRGPSRFEQQQTKEVNTSVDNEIKVEATDTANKIANANGLTEQQKVEINKLQSDIEKYIELKKNARDSKEIAEIDAAINAKKAERDRLINGQ